MCAPNGFRRRGPLSITVMTKRASSYYEHASISEHCAIYFWFGIRAKTPMITGRNLKVAFEQQDKRVDQRTQIDRGWSMWLKWSLFEELRGLEPWFRLGEARRKFVGVALRATPCCGGIAPGVRVVLCEEGRPRSAAPTSVLRSVRKTNGRGRIKTARIGSLSKAPTGFSSSRR